MRNLLPWLAGLCLLFVLQLRPAQAQNLRNDGFQRRNGQMHVLRNGQLRPMTRDARLPTGAVVTKDGFIRTANGTRTELREGQGCDLKGNLVAVVPTAGGFALAAPGERSRRAAATPIVVQAALEDLFGRRSDDEYERDDYSEYDKKRAEQAREQRKKWKEKRKKGKHWND